MIQFLSAKIGKVVFIVKVHYKTKSLIHIIESRSVHDVEEDISTRAREAAPRGYFIPLVAAL